MSGEQWVQCGCGQRHWGAYGAAGLLLVDQLPARRVIVQHRAEWTHFGGFWGIPGGARHRAEGALDGALREAAEEAAIDPAATHPVATRVLQHPDWSYTTVLARADDGVQPQVSDTESQDVSWVDLDDLDTLPLLPALAQAWPELRRMAGTAATLIVDAANVVGSRPDGWWRDRAGATRRLLVQLEGLARAGVPASLLGLPGHWWWPQILLVTEGMARHVQPAEADLVQIIRAPGEGDDQIVAEARARREGHGAAVLVATADRELISRLAAHGAGHLRPRGLLDRLPAT